MDFWRIYKISVARWRLILAVVLLTLLTVVVAKKIVAHFTYYAAVAEVLPSPKAMSPEGLYQNNKDGTMSRTYDRYSRLAMLMAKVQSLGDTAVTMAALPSVEQKRIVVRALSNQLSGPARTIWQNSDATEADFNAILQNFGVPISDTVWAPRTVTPATRLKIAENLEPTPLYNNAINQTPGQENPTPTLTDYILVNAHAPNGPMAEQIATLAAAEFINGYYDEGTQENTAAAANLQQQRRAAIAEQERAEQALSDFQRQTGLINLPAQTNQVVSRLDTLRQQLNTAQSAEAGAAQAADADMRQAQQVGPQLITRLDPAGQPAAQKLQGQIADEKAALSALLARYTPANPEYQRALAKVNADEQEYAQMLRTPVVVSQQNPEYATLLTDAATQRTEADREAAIVSQLSNQIAAVQLQDSATFSASARRLIDLQNAADTATADRKAADQAYRSLLLSNKALDTGMITLTRAANLALPDVAGPTLLSLLLYAFVLSLIVGIALAVCLEVLDRRIQTPEDAEKLIGLPISAMIPQMLPGDQRHSMRTLISDPLSPIAEAYRLLRTDLLFTAEDKPFKSLMCATAKPGQGATTTICNLAVALAQVGKRVILIDADLRRPKLHDFFGVSNATGLTSLLNGDCDLEEALKYTDVDNLILLPSGPLPVNPAELLASQKMRTLHERLKPHTDFILVDTPSAIAFSDSTILASFMDAVVLVVRAQEAPRGGERNVRNMLHKARANIVGVVLNGVKPELVDSYFYHSAYYPAAPLERTGAHVLPPPGEPQYKQPPGLPDGYEPTLMGVTFNHAYPAAHPSSPDDGADDPVAPANEILDVRRSRGR